MKPISKCNVLGTFSLNPFEFRAGLKPLACQQGDVVGGLNPFEFRAGLKPAVLASGKVKSVLIPLNSGLA